MDRVKLLQPSFLSGLTLPDWIRLLRDNSARVEPRYIPRTVVATMGAALTSLLSCVEPRPIMTNAQQETWNRTIFILGLARSGTTYLQNLLAMNPELAYPTRLDCYNPHTLLVLRRLGLHRILGMVKEKKRLIDNVKTGWLTPEEDSIALTVMTADGQKLAAVFGQREHFYIKQGPQNPEWRGNDIWKKAMTEFTQKLVWLHNRQLVLKSPSHAVHLTDILEVFPDARFVTIFRNPFDQNRSLRTFNRTVCENDWCALQTRTSAPDDQVTSFVNNFMTSYFTTKHLIPQQNLLEVTYESLVASPLETLRSIHEKLGIPGMEALATRLANDNQNEQYQNNRHSELTRAEQEQVRRGYAPLFAAGYYADILNDMTTNVAKRTINTELRYTCIHT